MSKTIKQLERLVKEWNEDIEQWEFIVISADDEGVKMRCKVRAFEISLCRNQLQSVIDQSKRKTVKRKAKQSAGRIDG